MTMAQSGEFYQRLGVKRVINGASWLTRLGGSLMPMPVVRAMEDASRWFVDMNELNQKAGDVIATGTPSGVGFFQKPPAPVNVGDIMRVEIEGLGFIENEVIAEPENVTKY